MGVQDIQSSQDGEHRRMAVRRVLDDLAALERMIDTGLIETDRRRIGAEQELVLVTDRLAPAPIADEVLEHIDDERVTTEIARFNLEFNCDPVDFKGDCLSSMRDQMALLLGMVRNAAARHGARPLLAGICPTIELSHLSRDNITPRPRYFALDDNLRAMRGADYELRVKGADELKVSHPSVMLEALNASFQIHYQVAAEEFAERYNVAQAVAAPIVAACANSPILFGKRLWRETRIAVFQQVVDTRSDVPHQRDLLARVRFGEEWVERSVLEIYRADVARFRMILAAEQLEDAGAELDAGRIPRLRALQAFNSTVYRWNRPCYGLTDGRPHLRIENRVLPSGPTIADEIANAALWLGIMHEGPHEWPNLSQRLSFDDARANFISAAREGLACQLEWLDGETVPADRLVLDRLIPAARRGLERAGLDAADIESSLSIVEARVRSGQTGATWILRSAAAMRDKGTRAQRLHRLTRDMLAHQAQELPAHEWELATLDDADAGAETWTSAYATVSQYMTTDLFTVSEDECIDLVASIMDWEHVRHVPVEDGRHRLVGLVSYRTLLRLLAQRRPADVAAPVAVSDIMTRNPLTVRPDTPTLEAIELMRSHGVACLPVVENDRLVGIVSERDYLTIAHRLFESALSADDAEGDGQTR